jgi:hypothetical protein
VNPVLFRSIVLSFLVVAQRHKLGMPKPISLRPFSEFDNSNEDLTNHAPLARSLQIGRRSRRLYWAACDAWSRLEFLPRMGVASERRPIRIMH